MILVAGARPNFMKVGPIHAELSARGINTLLLHTGQHYDHNMSQVFFDDLGIPEPDIHMGVGSDSHSRQTAKIMIEFEKVCLRKNPTMVIVVGDVNSTLACSITAKKLGIAVAHVEAGLRSRDMSMPEEVNRVLTDRISDILFTTSEGANSNLLDEGCKPENIFFVGNVMIDSLVKVQERLPDSIILNEIGLNDYEYCLATLHRPSNVDVKERLSGIISAFATISSEWPVVIPIHPRTKKSLEKFELMDQLSVENSIHLVPPLGYIDFLRLASSSKFVMTDSGGLQEETTFLGIPCLTIRENTERPITVTEGSNKIVGTEFDSIVESFQNIDFSENWSRPKLWDGKTSFRIADIIQDYIS